MCKAIKIIFILILLFCFYPVNLNAQQWSAEQKEVWKTVETYNDLAVKRDIEGFLSYFDDSYRGWEYDNDVPDGKEAVKKYIASWPPNSKILYINLTPAAIWVNGNFAYAHYYYSELSEDKDGKRQFEKGRWTDILMKKDGKWVMVGDHGGKTSK
jgi:ketosteroid isomerase-like protein